MSITKTQPLQYALIGPNTPSSSDPPVLSIAVGSGSKHWQPAVTSYMRLENLRRLHSGKRPIPSGLEVTLKASAANMPQYALAEAARKLKERFDIKETTCLEALTRIALDVRTEFMDGLKVENPISFKDYTANNISNGLVVVSFAMPAGNFTVDFRGMQPGGVAKAYDGPAKFAELKREGR